MSIKREIKYILTLAYYATVKMSEADLCVLPYKICKI